ncbi:hypothetical protein [Planctomyces sp. SH-PL62]|uniref:hypothetical protein n=1 Tax=Planctomyces sp. SH-PL62 TaxID=1636152 RepID=UPI00078E91B6|nr:hypothetical protein [Planctomyces sp. SH-PL62]AMV40248.1 hypothetical protein VT85_22645 [Planctomyces sp. SH-PL62]
MTNMQPEKPPFPRLVIANPKFPLGDVVMTANAAEQLPSVEVAHALCRHASGDWGEVCEDDRASNEEALTEGYRLLSVYRAGETVFWIITEADRSVTTVLMPDDY